MKSASVVVAAVVIVASVFAGAHQTTEPTKQSVVTLKVSGMACHLCAATVERVAKELAGVMAAKADQPKGVAEITYDVATTSPAEIARLLTKRSGFKTEVPSKQKK